MSTAQKVIKYLAIALAIFIIANIISGILFGLYSLASVLGLTKTNETETANQNEIISQQEEITNLENEKFETLKIKLVYSNLTIKKGDTLKVESNNKYVSIKPKDNQLEIKEDVNKWLSRSNSKNSLTIYIPENTMFENVKIEAGAGNIKIEQLQAKELNFEIGAGKVEIEKLNVSNKAQIEGGAGKVDILSGEMNNLNLDMGVGKFELTSKLTGKSKINAGVGKLDINLSDGIKNYKMEISKGIGAIKIDGKEMKDDTEFGEGDNLIKIDGGIGAIDIK